MRTRIAIILVLTLALSRAALAAGFKVIVNPANPITSVTKKDLSALLLKKTPKWQDGVPVAAVDQTERSSVRELFTSSVHGKTVNAVKSYWQQQIFSGRDVPPVEKSSDADVVAFVKANRGAVGYVSEGTSTTGAKVVDVQ